jgi:TRAP-type C4-dicarboxylate transport system permease small subunit
MRTFIRIEEWLARAFLAGSSLLVFVAAIARTMGEPLIWAIDVAQLLFIWCCFLGADQAMRAKQHIIIDILVRTFPQRIQRLLLLMHWSVIIGFLALLTWFGIQLTLLNLERPMGDTEIPYAFVTSAVPAGCLLLILTAGRQLAESWSARSARIGSGDSPL